MKTRTACLFALVATAAFATDPPPDPPHVCEPCDYWNTPAEPVRVFGNSWFVGTKLGAALITSDQGHILIDGGLPQSAPLIAASIRKAGFRVEDVRLIVNSHTHYDHAGGISWLQRVSNAEVAASPAAKRALENGGPLADDPQFTFGPAHNNYPAVKKVRAIADGETLRVGDLAITVHFTPGHTTGGTSWSWRSCEGTRCVNLVYADSLNAVSAPGFRFSDDAERVKSFERSIGVVEALPCDLLLSAHTEFMDLPAKLQRLQQQPDVNPFIDPGACRAYAAGARERLAKRLAGERAAKP